MTTEELTMTEQGGSVPSDGFGVDVLRDSNTKTLSDKGELDDTMLPECDNPFAVRQGRKLKWRNVNMVLEPSAKNDLERRLLEDVWGEVPEKQTTAIMGPSGAGKTSLLNILAGRVTTRGRVLVKSDVRLDGGRVNPTKMSVRQSIAFVAQEDSLSVTATPREAIYFSAKLRLPKSIPEASLNRLVSTMLKELGLEACADTYIGGGLIKGISGGEKKRTSVGVELVIKPAMVFLDEPTSGLDSFSAVQVCQVLKKVALAGSSVLFTIHQPSSEIFNSFDRLIVLNKGRVMYQGLVTEVPAFFAEHGHPLPPNFNPADWIIDVAQTVSFVELDRAGFFSQENDRSSKSLIAEDNKSADETNDTIAAYRPVPSPGRVGVLTQMRLLFVRELRSLRRDTGSLIARLSITIFLSLLIGVIFFGVGKENLAVNANLNSHFGVVVMVLLEGMFGTAQPALLSFPRDRPIFLREYSTDHYSVLSYFAARFTMEAFTNAIQILLQLLISFFLIGLQAPFGMFYLTVYMLAMSSTALAVWLGCSVEDIKFAQELLPVLFVPQMLFAGFFVVPSLIPVWLRWARYVCSLMYAVRVAAVLEFNDGDCSDNQDANDNCRELLDSIDADGDETYWNWLVLMGIFVAFRLSALVLLRRKATKFY